MAGSCTSEFINDPITGRIIGYKFDWTSDASGDVSGVGAINITRIDKPGGMINTIVGAQFVPDTGGTAPTDLYDATLINSDGVDVLQGVGADLPQSVTSISNYRTPLTTDGGYVLLMGDTLTPVVANAGNAKGGTIYLFII